MALPQYQLAVLKARFTELQTVSSSLSKMVEMYYMANGAYPTHWTDLDITIPGCKEEGSLYDLVCQKIRIDLNEKNFMGWDSVERTSGSYTTPQNNNVQYYYYFLNAENSDVSAGKFLCQGHTDNGKKLCRSLCGSETCYL